MAVGNPTLALLVRRIPGLRRRFWRPLEGLIAPTPGDYPIVSAELADLIGRPHGLIAICRQPTGRTPAESGRA